MHGSLKQQTFNDYPEHLQALSHNIKCSKLLYRNLLAHSSKLHYNKLHHNKPIEMHK